MRRAALSLVCLTAPFISPFVAAANGAQSPARRPNVVVILADDLGAGELGCYGQTRIRTPHIDSIAARGVRFTDGYSGAPVCAPSRCALLTGRHTGHAAVRDNWEAGGWGPDEPEGQLPLPAEEITLAERLRALGYRTGGFGKWGLGGPGTEGAPERQGFDHFHGYLCQRVAHNYFPTHLWRNGERVEIPGAKWFSAHQKPAEPLDGPAAYAARFGGPTASYAPQRIADDMLSWLDEAAASDDPFFLYYASVIPHLALQVPDAYVERYPEDWDAAPYLGQRGYLPHPSPRRAYAAMITFLDDQVGRVLALLEERGELENTLVLFTSDNGATYVGGVDTAFFASHDGRRGHKGQVWEGGVRVPFLAMWPGRIPAGSTSAHVVSGVDVTATVLEAAGARPAAGLDSVSLLAAARGDASAPRPPLYWEHRPAGAQAVRDGRWKLVRAGLKPKQTERVELYDLTADPAEARDLAAEHPETVERLRAVLADQHTPNRRFPLPKTDPPRPRRESR